LVTDSHYILYEDHNGDLWGGLDDGLYRVQDNEGKISFQKMPLSTSRQVNVTTLYEARDGSLWIGTIFTLLRRLPDGREFYYDFSIPCQDVVTNLVEDREGTIWVGRASGVYAIKPESLAEISTGRVPTNRKFDELAKSQPATQTHVTVPAKSGEIFHYAFFSDVLHSKNFYQTSHVRLWILDGSKVASFDGQNFEVLEPSAGSQTVVIGMAEDASGNLWFAGPSGLMRFDRHGLISYGPDEGLKAPGVLALGETTSGGLYIAGDNFFMSTFDGHSFRSFRLPVPATAGALWTSNPIFQDREGEWWVLTSIGLYHFGAANEVTTVN